MSHCWEQAVDGMAVAWLAKLLSKDLELLRDLLYQEHGFRLSHAHVWAQTLCFRHYGNLELPTFQGPGGQHGQWGHGGPVERLSPMN